jgi:peptide/nickel transport system permease protein
MLRFVLKRILLAVVSVWAISTITFFIAYLAPGDPILLRYGEHSSPQAIAALRHLYGLDLPPLVRYGHFLKGILHGDLGRSFFTDESITGFLARGFPVTAFVAVLALLWAMIAGILVGIIAALKPGTWINRTLMAATLAGVSIPNFVLAPILVGLFALKLGWLPVTSTEYPPGWWLLPSLVLAARPAALIGRMTRTSMLETLKQDYIRTARAKGLNPRRVIFVHALKNAFMPVLTTAGVSFGYLLSGSFVVETIFAIPGVGQASVASLTMRDYSLIQGTTLLLASIFVVINLLIDLLYAALDPRVRGSLSEASA